MKCLLQERCQGRRGIVRVKTRGCLSRIDGVAHKYTGQSGNYREVGESGRSLAGRLEGLYDFFQAKDVQILSRRKLDRDLGRYAIRGGCEGYLRTCILPNSNSTRLIGEKQIGQT